MTVYTCTYTVSDRRSSPYWTKVFSRWKDEVLSCLYVLWVGLLDGPWGMLVHPQLLMKRKEGCIQLWGGGFWWGRGCSGLALYVYRDSGFRSKLEFYTLFTIESWISKVLLQPTLSKKGKAVDPDAVLAWHLVTDTVILLLKGILTRKQTSLPLVYPEKGPRGRLVCFLVQWNPSITDTFWNQHFFRYREVSPTQELPVYFR